MLLFTRLDGGNREKGKGGIERGENLFVWITSEERRGFEGILMDNMCKVCGRGGKTSIALA